MSSTNPIKPQFRIVRALADLPPAPAFDGAPTIFSVERAVSLAMALRFVQDGATPLAFPRMRMRFGDEPGKADYYLTIENGGGFAVVPGQGFATPVDVALKDFPARSFTLDYGLDVSRYRWLAVEFGEVNFGATPSKLELQVALRLQG